MLHVRVVCPPASTGALAGFLASAPGVSAVLVQAGAARRPAGDAVSFDLRDGAANPVFATMRELGLDRGTGVAVEQIDAELTAEPSADAHHGVLEREVTPVWEIVDATIRAGACYAPSFYILLAIAGLIGAAGILTN